MGPPSRNPPTPRRPRPLLSPSDPGNRAGEAATAEEEGAVVATAAQPEFFCQENGLPSPDHILSFLMGQDPI